MKKLILLSCLSMLSIQIAAAAPTTSKEVKRYYAYKCHLVLSDKREVVRDYERQPKNQNGNLERLILNQQVAVEKGKRLTIAEVLECVERDSEFSKATSRELDRATLR